jgi:cytochrome b pre-mRNA-processing protein 3
LILLSFTATDQLKYIHCGNTMPLLKTSVNGFWKSSHRLRGETLCLSVMQHARNPYFYENWGVPDTLEGRFDCAVLHLYLLLRHVRGSLAQAVFNAFFAYTELTLREEGVSDLRVGKQVKKCAKFFYGAAKAYEQALKGHGSLEDALERNLYGGLHASGTAEIAAYVRHCDQVFKTQDLATREVSWPAVPYFPEKISLNFSSESWNRAPSLCSCLQNALMSSAVEKGIGWV